MRWHHVGVIAVVVVLSGGVFQSRCHAGWMTLTIGQFKVADPVSASTVWFDFPNGQAVLAVNRVTGVGTVRAASAGGAVFFGGLGTPVVLDLSDGSASLSGGNLPAGVNPESSLGMTNGKAASAVPLAGSSIPSNAVLLDISYSDVRVDGARYLTAAVTNRAGGTLGSTTLAVPTDGWWVLGFGPDQRPALDSDESHSSSGDGLLTDPTPLPGPVPGVPEPATLALGVSGLIAGGLVRRRRNRKTETNLCQAGSTSI
jgi:hypothetical protein